VPYVVREGVLHPAHYPAHQRQIRSQRILCLGEMRRLLEINPLPAGTEGRGTGGQSYFRFEEGRKRAGQRVGEMNAIEAEGTGATAAVGGTEGAELASHGVLRAQFCSLARGVKTMASSSAGVRDEHGRIWAPGATATID
jgi:hypothetical protein